MNLSEHFKLEEFEKDGAMPLEAVPSYTTLCTTLLEPIRANFNVPVLITSGYRSAAVNEKDHGVSNSQHIATAECCAADFFLATMNKTMRPVFDWIRDSQLKWDQVILETYPEDGDQIIHISWSLDLKREALEGEMFNKSGYTPWPVAPLVETV